MTKKQSPTTLYPLYVSKSKRASCHGCKYARQYVELHATLMLCAHELMIVEKRESSRGLSVRKFARANTWELAGQYTCGLREPVIGPAAP